LKTQSQEAFGRFVGDIVAKFLPDGRNMRLELPFVFVDPAGKHWRVPAGTVTDGASIPRVLWITHPPFTGKYRSAAIIHDYFCQTRTHPWRETHIALYQAMRAAGVDDPTAKTIYGAVYYFGPRWGIGQGSRGPGAERGLSEMEEKALLGELSRWIEREKPNLDQIRRRLDGR
jgi:hypothetical protein